MNRGQQVIERLRRIPRQYGWGYLKRSTRKKRAERRPIFVVLGDYFFGFVLFKSQIHLTRETFDIVKFDLSKEKIEEIDSVEH